jgi:hypothetical protein
VPLGLAALSLVLALVQRPGYATSDTKIDLHVDPGGFLGNVASVWTPSGALGHVQGGQYSGYLFPMGPFYALGHALGLPDWLVGRLWLALLIALAAWGVVRLLDALYDRERGIAHAAAGVLIVLNPYVVVFSNQTSVTLLGYAALPWLLLAVHQGLRRPRGWWWPAAAALILTACGGGVNAAVVAWLLPAVVLLALYEALRGLVPWRAVRGFALRAVPLAAVASLWWVAPVLVQARFGIDFLKFTEQQGAIWSTTSLSEAIRLMSYWISYVGIGFGARPEPYFSDSPALLFALPVVLATLLVPALCLAGFVWTRRWRYGPFFLLLVLVGLVTMTVGFPEGTPLRSAANFTYNHLSPVQFLRTTYKAAPMVALGLACLGGVAAAEAWARLGRQRLRVAALAAGVVLVALASWPLVSGQAVERKLAWKEIPAAWKQAARDLDRKLPSNTRAVVLPGQLFAFYRWGGTVDPILPTLTDRPVAVRSIVPYADLRAIDLLWTADTLLQQQRALPGQLLPLVRALGAGAVVTGTDDDRNLSGAMSAAEAAVQLAAQGFGRPSASYGPVRGFRPTPQMLGAGVGLPQVRRYDVDGAAGLVRLESAPRGTTVVDGSAQGLAGLAAFGSLPPPGEPFFYAADSSPEEIRRAREVVISDSNRRRSFLSSQMLGNVGPTVAASEPLSVDAAALNPFPDAGSDGQTVAEYDGAAYLRAPLSPNFTQFPEHRPYAAFDRSPETSWLADPEIDKSRSWIEIGFDGERAVDHIDLLPHDDSRASVTAVEIAGRRFPVKAGWNRIELALPAVRSLRVRIVGVRRPADLPRGAGGFDEIRIPGVSVRERLRPPVLATRALAENGGGRRGQRLTYLFDRTTADIPYRTGSLVDEAQKRSRADRQDPEPLLSRVFDLPRATDFSAEAWTSIDPRAPDTDVDRFAGYRGDVEFTSSSRFDGVPGYRASGAFDGDRRRAWIGTWLSGRPAWIAWRSPQRRTVRTLRLVRLDAPVRFPTRVRVVYDGGGTAPIEVGAGGAVRLPEAVRSRSFRIDVLASAYPPGAPDAERARRAVAVAEVLGGPVARVPASGDATFACGDARLKVDGASVRLEPRGSVADLDRGTPLRATDCDRPDDLVGFRLARGSQRLDALPGPVRIDHLRLASAPRIDPAVKLTPLAKVLDPGTFGRSRIDGVRLKKAAGSWLVLGESYNRGWRAYCGDDSLGDPVPIDGYANGWRVVRDCTEARFEFVPQRTVTWGYALSGLACVVLLAFLVIARRRRRVDEVAPGSHAPDSATDAAVDNPRRVSLPLAAAVALPAAGALAFMFALRAGPAIWLVLTLVLWRGIGARTLTLAAGALLGLVVPVLYVLFPGPDRGGFNPEYAIKHLGAHWVAVAAYVLLTAALARALWQPLSRASRASGDPPGEPVESAPSRAPA